MNKELIYQIREEYKELHKIAKGDLQEIEELEQQPVVQRYKYLFSLKDALARVDDCYIQAHIMGEIINKYGNGLMEPTNKLWFWFFDVTVGQYEKMFEKELEETDKDRMVCVYLDLENQAKLTGGYTETVSGGVKIITSEKPTEEITCNIEVAMIKTDTQ